MGLPEAGFETPGAGGCRQTQMLATKAEVPCQGICAWAPDADSRLHRLSAGRRHSGTKIHKAATCWKETAYPCPGKRPKGLRQGARLEAAAVPPVQGTQCAVLPSEGTGQGDSRRLGKCPELSDWQGTEPTSPTLGVLRGHSAGRGVLLGPGEEIQSFFSRYTLCFLYPPFPRPSPLASKDVPVALCTGVHSSER